MIQQFTSMRTEAEKDITRLINKINVPILTIPDIGNALGSVIPSEIRAIKNFRSPNQLLAYTDTEPSISTLAANQTAAEYIVKRGSF